MDPMVKATWRNLALSALMGAVALPAAAQVVVGGSARPSVEVNWAVLDSLGRQPTLADMLKSEIGVKAVVPARRPGAQPGITYRPYKAQATKLAAKPTAKKAMGEAKKRKITPVAVKTEIPVSPAVSALVRAAQKAEPVKVEPKVVAQQPAQPAVVQASAQPVATQMPAQPAVVQASAQPIGPQVALPEAKPKPIAKTEPPAAAPAEPPKPTSAPMQIAKVDAPPPAPTPAPMPVSALAAPALTPAPQPMARPEPVPQVAALPGSGVVAGKGGDTISVVFSGDDAKLPGGSQADLHALAKRMGRDEGLGLQLLAYAAGDDAGASKARRLSLSRALEVRKYLMEQGVRSTRIEVRALGNKLAGAGPADRVDAVVVTR